MLYANPPVLGDLDKKVLSILSCSTGMNIYDLMDEIHEPKSTINDAIRRLKYYDLVRSGTEEREGVCVGRPKTIFYRVR